MDSTLLLVIIIYLIFSINYNSIRQLRTTADKRLRFTSPKLPSATSFIRETLYEIANPAFKEERYLYRLNLTELMKGGK